MFVTDVTDKTVFCLIGLRGLLSRLCSDFVFRIDSSLCFSQTFIYGFSVPFSSLSSISVTLGERYLESSIVGCSLFLCFPLFERISLLFLVVFFPLCHFHHCHPSA